MLTVEFREYGAVDRLLLADAPMPEPGTGEVLIEVHACGVNRVDILSREGQTPTPVLLPHISGTEVAGQIAALGKGVQGWKEGDRILVNPTQSCSRCEACREGRDNMCRNSRVLWGSNAGWIRPIRVGQG